jgi:hypothetical protein
MMQSTRLPPWITVRHCHAVNCVFKTALVQETYSVDWLSSANLAAIQGKLDCVGS